MSAVRLPALISFKRDGGDRRADLARSRHLCFSRFCFVRFPRKLFDSVTLAFGASEFLRAWPVQFPVDDGLHTLQLRRLDDRRTKKQRGGNYVEET